MTQRVSDLQKARLVAHILDTSLRIPGTNFRFGFDAIIDVIPGIGAAIGGALSLYIVIVGMRLGVARATIFRMAFNICLDVILGSVPVFGVLFDASWKANIKNVQLIEQSLYNGQARQHADALFIASIMLGLLLIAASMAWVGVYLISSLFYWLQGYVSP